MSNQQALDWAVNYGLGVVLSVGIAIAFWRILIFVLKENSKREDRLASIIEMDIKNLESTAASNQNSAIDFRKQLMETIRYEREEHRQISEILNGIKSDIQGIKNAR